MDALCNFHGNQDIYQLAIPLWPKLCHKVSWYSLDHAMPESEQLHNYPSSNPTLTCHQLAVGG